MVTFDLPYLYSMKSKSRLGDAGTDRTVFIKSSPQDLLLIFEAYQVLSASPFLVLKVNSFDDIFVWLLVVCRVHDIVKRL